MSCTHPLYALDLGVNPDTGKKIIKFLSPGRFPNYEEACNSYGKENILLLPCGKCESCIESRTKSWAARCCLEASLYEKNCFVTLTYRNACLPKYGLCKKDVQNFIKRLRKKHPGVRYFLTGEYGSVSLRPHYHLLIFNYLPDDLKFKSVGEFGGSLYTSSELNDLWSFGNVIVGDLTFASCAYVARYCQKKLHQVGTYKEFCCMSLKPGIGQKYFEEHFETIYETDKIYFHFGEGCNSLAPFKYFDKLLENIDSDLLEKVKNQRIDRANSVIVSALFDHGFTHYEKLLKQKDEKKSDQFKLLQRKGV